MSHVKFFSRVAVALVCGFAFGFTGVVRAQMSTGPVTPLEVAIEKEPVTTAEPIYRAYLTVQIPKVHTNKFTFLIPQGYRLQNDPMTGRMVLANKDGDSTITFAIIGPWTSPDVGPSLATCRTFAAGKMAHAVFVNEVGYDLSPDKGRMLDMEWRTPEDILQHKRAIYLGTGAGLLEFTATTGETGVREMQFVLDQLVKSFHYSTNGRLYFIPLSDKI